jgi:hypothetical protein
MGDGCDGRGSSNFIFIQILLEMDLFIDQSIKWNPTQQKYIDDDGYPADFKCGK